MALKRVWIPTSNYSSRGGSAVRLLVVHTTEGAQTYQDLGNFFQGDVGASSHVGIDNRVIGTIGEYVSHSNKAWTACNANPVCIQAEQCTPKGAAANWSRSYWLNDQETLLRNTADWVSEECKRYGIPLTILTASQAQNGGRGICQHRDLGSWGTGHSDCGNGYPLDQVVAWAKGGNTNTDTNGVTAMATTTTDSAGREWSAGIWTDGKVNVCTPENEWYAIDTSQSGAKGVADIHYDAEHDKLIVTYINAAGELCSYRKNPNAPRTEWSWSSKKGKLKT